MREPPRADVLVRCDVAALMADNRDGHDRGQINEQQPEDEQVRAAIWKERHAAAFASQARKAKRASALNERSFSFATSRSSATSEWGMRIATRVLLSVVSSAMTSTV